MEVNVNYLAVILGAVSQMILGFLWYGPIFGKAWAKMKGFTKQDEEAGKKGMGITYGLMFVGALIMSYVLYHFIQFSAIANNVDTLTAGVLSGFWAWLGFAAPIQLGAILFNNKPRNYKLYAIDTGYYLVGLVIMGAILGALK